MILLWSFSLARWLHFVFKANAKAQPDPQYCDQNISPILRPRCATLHKSSPLTRCGVPHSDRLREACAGSEKARVTPVDDSFSGFITEPLTCAAHLHTDWPFKLEHRGMSPTASSLILSLTAKLLLDNTILSSMGESSWSESEVSGWSFGEASVIKPAPSRPVKSSDGLFVSTRPKALPVCFGRPHSTIVTPSSTAEVSSNNNPFPLDIILKEIDNEFKMLQGEPVYTFGRQPTPGLESIREAIRRHTEALLDKIRSMESEAEKEENRKALAKKRIREAIMDGRNEALECRIRTIENLLVDHLPLA